MTEKKDMEKAMIKRVLGFIFVKLALAVGVHALAKALARG